VPRKYHRPPDTATRRRKARKSPIPYEFEAPPAEAAFDEGLLPEDGDADPAAPVELVRRSAATGARGERHVTVDYGYVRWEIVQIAAIMAFLVLALVITSIFR
jgi:hypothetical protein